MGSPGSIAVLLDRAHVIHTGASGILALGMSVPDDIDFSSAIQRQRRIVAVGVECRVGPARTAVDGIMNAPIVS